MADQGKQPHEAGFPGRLGHPDLPIAETWADRPEGLGLDDLTDSELAEVDTGPLGGEGGLGFDDLTDAERDRLTEQRHAEGGLGLDDTMVVETDEDEYRAA